MHSRYVSLSASLVGALFNFALAVRLLALWRSLRWETESEWEGSAIAWRVDPVKLVWGLLSAYFATGAAASAVGFLGIARNMPLLVRFFRDYSIADFVFVTLSTVTISYTAFTTSYLRAGVCEELSRQPELLRDVVDTGLTIENCEFWFERATVAILGLMFVLIAVRLHFVIALSKCYNQVRRDRYPTGKSHARPSAVRTDSLQRIYLLPTPTSSSNVSFNHHADTHDRARSMDEVMVYAPVPLGGLSEQEARHLNATEAWVPVSSHVYLAIISRTLPCTDCDTPLPLVMSL
ncbi:hypothetical protein EUX98_g5064 [Antrodiella citrinella]|uniref:Uncharacterized protein n=1 Tax=Antrodiella citrinella TaxID=2447956 RepID=A0A4S4MSK1_9APHY|nr:hypothetical protein EUX98_g5064 [Antrodiella citrinella]